MLTSLPAPFPGRAFLLFALAVFSLVFLNLLAPPSARAQAPSYILTDLGNFGTGQNGQSSSAANAINQSGQIAGYSEVYDANGVDKGQAAFLYRNGKMINLGNLGTDSNGMSSSGVEGLNDASQVVVVSKAYDASHVYQSWSACLYSNGTLTDLSNFSTDSNGSIRGFSPYNYTYNGRGTINAAGQVVGSASVYDANGTFKSKDVFVYSNGQMTDLGNFGDTINDSAINDAGQVIINTGDFFSKQKAFLYSGGAVTPLGVQGNSTVVAAINNAGQVIGSSDITFENTTSYKATVGFLYSNGQTIDLGNLGVRPSDEYSYTLPQAINDAGQIVGYAQVFDATSGYVGDDIFLYSNGQMKDLGNLGTNTGFESAKAVAINNAGQVVGVFNTGFNKARNEDLLQPFLYSGGTFYDLFSLVTNSTGWTDLIVTGLNDAGQIIGYGTHNGQNEAFLLTPQTTHLLWTHTSGAASVWSINTDGTFSYQLYGPYDGWSATQLAEGPDGQARLLWTHAGGLASLWNLGDAHPDQTCVVYGPFVNWNATGISVGGDNMPHLLWQYSTGLASVWNVNTDGTYAFQYYGPYDGWTASQIAGGSGGAVRLLWTHAGGIASLWNLADAHPDQSYFEYGPYDGWSAVGLSVGVDNLAHLLWTHTTGLASAWSVNTDGTYSYQVYGPYAGWSATGISGDAGGGAHLLWTHEGGLASLWNLADAQPDQTCDLYGPFDGWSAVSLAAGP